MGNKVQAITAIFTHPQKGFLLYQRDDGNGKKIPYPNTWSFFGGTVEEGETILGCLIREMKEELELELDPSRCREIHVYDHDNGTDHVFHCPLEGDEDENFHLHEGRQKQWMTLEQIKALHLAWHQEELFPSIDSLSL